MGSNQRDPQGLARKCKELQGIAGRLVLAAGTSRATPRQGVYKNRTLLSTEMGDIWGSKRHAVIGGTAKTPKTNWPRSCAVLRHCDRKSFLNYYILSKLLELMMQGTDLVEKVPLIRTVVRVGPGNSQNLLLYIVTSSKPRQGAYKNRSQLRVEMGDI